MNTILIAEDEKFIRRGLRTMIERSPVPTGEILEARDGEEALELLRAHPADLLVTDIRMPRMDGIELVSRLGELARPPMVLVVSGYDDFSYAVEMLCGGAQDYLLKPVERERLYEALEKLEERYRQEQAAREEQERQLHRALRQLMLEGAGGEHSGLLERARGAFFPGAYVGFCAGGGEYPLPEGALCLRGTGSVIFFAVPAEECERAAQEFLDYENKQKIRQAVQYMQENFRQPLNMAQVSNHVSMNYSLFSLLFKQYTGSNFVNYMQKLRLSEAKKLLEATDWRVNEIGRRAGFADEKRFLKVFKAAVGVSPTEYRRSAALLDQTGQAGDPE